MTLINLLAIRIPRLFAKFVGIRAVARRRVPAISGHLQEIIWAVIVVVLGIVGYTFFSGTGVGGQWFHNILNSVTQFTD